MGKNIKWPDAPYEELINSPKEGDIVAVWFSCGAASAVALQQTILKYGNLCEIRVLNNYIANEDKDNLRFKNDVSNWLNVNIENVINPKYPSCDVEDVFEKENFMSNPHGAPCTRLLKKEARYIWERKNKADWHVLGYPFDEKGRFNSFYNTERSNVLPVLIERKITKQDCYNIINNAGLVLPKIYSIKSDFGDGYPNANCIGCVKATSPTYWNHVRQVHPEVFQKRSEQSRKVGREGAKLVRYKGKRIFLDELPPDARGRPMDTMKIECSLFCSD
jgi:hypothetical protein